MVLKSDWSVTYFSRDVMQHIMSWPEGIKAKYLRIIDLIEEFGPQIGPPHTKAMGKGLFEIRVKAKEGIGRAFFCYKIDNKIVVLHSFIKKTQKTPKKELAIALQCMGEI